MGTFAGHALPGSFFIIFSVWGIYRVLKAFYRHRAYQLNITLDPEPEYTSRVSYSIPARSTGCCKNRGIPLDSYLKVFCCLIGITGEVITGFKDGHFVHIGNAQHSSMFSGFALSGIGELLMFYGILQLPIQTELVFSMLAILAEGILFLFHLHGRTPVDVLIHMLLAGMIIVALIAGTGEMINPTRPTFALIRWWSMLMQGTWFWQIGAILYPPVSWMPKWSEFAKESMPRAANLFCYHMLVNFLFIVFMAALMSLQLGCLNATSVNTQLELSGKLDQRVATVDEKDEIEHWTRPSHNDGASDEVLNESI